MSETPKITCGRCDSVHTNEFSPEFEYTVREVIGYCQWCEAEMMRIPRGPRD